MMWGKDGFPLSTWITIGLVNIGFWTSNSKGATHWRFENGELNAVFGEEESIFKNDPIFNILANPATYGKTEVENTSIEFIEIVNLDKPDPESRALAPASDPSAVKFESAQLRCGDPVNETSIDHLDGIAARFNHPSYPEPEVALLFRKNEFDNVQLEVIEVNLIEAVKSAENKMILYVQIGNFLRIKGDTYHAIECFRNAYHVSSNNIDALLNLARMLSNLNYMKDAVYLAQLSLDVAISTEQNKWLQHYTLGELFEKHGELQKAYSHFQLALEENPSFQPAFLNLQRLGSTNGSSTFYTNIYTVVLMVIMCISILVYLYIHVIKEHEEANNNYNYKRTGFFKR